MVNWSPVLEKRIKYAVVALVVLAFVFELIRDCRRDGDFIGYVHAGQAVLDHTPIYADYLNTWPPFFSIFSVPLTLVHNVNPVLIRLLWLLGIGVAWAFIVRLTMQLAGYKDLHWGNANARIGWLDWAVLLPFLFVFRFIIDDLSNIQINSFLLLCSLLVVSLHYRKRNWQAGVLLGFIIALKVYPVFLLLFFIWKRKLSLVASALITIGVTVLLSFWVFGYETALQYYVEWSTSRIGGDVILTHKNQSLFPFFEGLFTHQSRGLGIYYNIMSLSPHQSKRIVYVLVGCSAIVPAYRFWNSSKGKLVPFYEVAFILAAIPVLSPLAWKYYFVFLFPLYVILFQSLFVQKVGGKWLKTIFFTSLAFSILSTDGLLGVWFSDVLEVFGCITWATVLLLFLSIRMRPKP